LRFQRFYETFSPTSNNADKKVSHAFRDPAYEYSKGGSEMKIAITSATAGALGIMDVRFGRAPYFLFFDTRNNTWEAHENTQNAQMEHGAGTQAAQEIINYGVKVLITGQIGPKALKVLRDSEIKVYCVGIGKVNEILTKFLEGHYIEYFAPNEKRETKNELHVDERPGGNGQERKECRRRYTTC
jgi:predicted Fe-Mo cluster-binding NifX family protein